MMGQDMQDDQDCTDCEGSGITHQTERYCTCAAGRELSRYADDAPERIWVADIMPKGEVWRKGFDTKPDVFSEHYNEYTRTDMCITDAECQRRIDAAVTAEREACANVVVTSPITTAPAMAHDMIAKDRADWLLDAIACATQNRQFLRGEPEYDEVAGEAILMNGEKAISIAISRAILKHDPLSDPRVVALAEALEWIEDYALAFPDLELIIEKSRAARRAIGGGA